VTTNNVLTIVEFDSDSDFEKAQAICRKQGYGESWAYITSSDPLNGLYLVPLRPGQPSKVVCKTLEFGMVVIETFDE